MWSMFMPPQIIVNKVSSWILLAKKIISLTDTSNLVMAGDWNTDNVKFIIAKKLSIEIR